MKKILIILLMIFMCFNLSACKDEEEENKEEKPVVVDETVDIRKNITLQDVGLVIGEYSNRYTVIRVNNSNDRAIYVDVKITYFDNNGSQVDARDVYVRVGAHRSAYAINRMFSEDVSFTSYKYDFDVSAEKLEDYESIYNNMSVTYVDNNNSVKIKFTNKGNRTSTVSAYVFFRSNGNIVAINDVTEYNLTPNTSKEQTISYPYKTYSTFIPFDRIEVILNEVSTEI